MSEHASEIDERYCIVSSGPSWFAFPALSVREVAVPAKVVQVPHSNAILSGLCNLRNEFLPVLSASALLETQGAANAEARMIVLSGVDGAWALLVETVAALEPLEVSFVRDWESTDSWTSSLIGSASYRDQIVQVLDPEGLHRFILNRLESSPLIRPSELASSPELAGTA